MKHLRINNNTGEFLRVSDWHVISELKGDDVLNLAKSAINDESFEMDSFEEDKLPNPAQRIIYEKVYNQLLSLQSRRDAFIDQTRNIYQDAYDKYCM